MLDTGQCHLDVTIIFSVFKLLRLLLEYENSIRQKASIVGMQY